ncbi:MAG TPA: M23 family metallopeptidase, partial [bacterium]|nr:M23 family metallopeptidase [bacterium]
VVAQGQLAWPIEPGKFKITSRFGERHSSPHQGVDFSAPRGTTIRAADDGVVIVASENLGGYGKTVVLHHPNGLRTVYGHADTLCVRLGQSVKRGQKIAEVGSTGRSTGFHLHFEVRVSADKPVDPMGYLTSK